MDLSVNQSSRLHNSSPFDYVNNRKIKEFSIFMKLRMWLNLFDLDDKYFMNMSLEPSVVQSGSHSVVFLSFSLSNIFYY